jgi:thymidylate synthase
LQQYLDVIRRVLDTGQRKNNRTGVDTLSTFNVNYQIDLREGFPLLTTKEISWKNIVVENLWFLSGDTRIDLLRKHGCKFWEPWADEDGLVPSAYGNFWRNYPVHTDGEETFNDQIRYVINELKQNPQSRRLVVSAWAPGNAQTSALPPCHAFWVMNVQQDSNGEPMLCLHLTQRSCDIALGLPYNIAGYAFLLELMARFTGIKPGYFGHTLIDAHIYTAKADGSMADYDHIPGLKTQLARAPRALPRLEISDEIKALDDVTALLEADTESLLDTFRLHDYQPHPALQFKVAV